MIIYEHQSDYLKQFERFTKRRDGTLKKYFNVKNHYDSYYKLRPKWYDLATVIHRLGQPEATNKFFDVVAAVLEAHDLTNENKICYAAALPHQNRIHLTLGGHYSISIEKKSSEFNLGLYCALEDYEKLKANYPQARKLNKRESKGKNIAVWMEIDPAFIEVKDIIDSVVSGVETEFKYSISNFRSGNSSLHNPWIFEAANDQKIRDALFNEKLDNLTELTEQTNSSMTRNFPLNVILYGPPGTGKTYNTINKAIEICNRSFDLGQPRETIKEEFARLTASGQVSFTTFHQSMSYEDFIEGLKPLEPTKEGDPITYKVEDGILKQICTNAAFSIGQEAASSETEKVLDFANLYDHFLARVNEDLSKGDVELSTKTGGSILIENISEKNNLILKHKEGSRTYTVSKNRLIRLNAEIDDLDEISNINDHFRSIIGGSNATAYWAVLNAILSTDNHEPTSTERILDYDEKKEVVEKMTKKDYSDGTGQPYVIIIDEINRGNVSQIFGELITLIEEDKRAGQAEAIEVVLPYSKSKFSIPPNLYIIGTMNTADRSVEALDVALRRRFHFEYKGPNYFLDELQFSIEGTEYTLAQLLETINDRITFLKDEDHQIGHSYLMNRNTLSSLQETFYKNIIPLLKEYFYNDYGKIRMVLGDGFVEKKEAYRPDFAADDEEVLDQTIFKIRPEPEIDILAAINGIFNKA